MALVYFSAKRGSIMADKIIKIAMTTRMSTTVNLDSAFMAELLFADTDYRSMCGAKS